MEIIKHILLALIIVISIPLSSVGQENTDGEKEEEILCNGTIYTRPNRLLLFYGIAAGLSYASSSIESHNINKCFNISYYENLMGVGDELDINYTLNIDLMNSKDEITKIYSAGAVFVMLFNDPREIYFTSSLITRIAYVDAPSYTIEENGEERSVSAKKAGAGADITFGIGKKNIVLEAFAGVINTKDFIYQKYGLQLKVLF